MGDCQDSQGPLPGCVGNPADGGAIITHTDRFTDSKAHRVPLGPEIAPEVSGTAPKYDSPSGLMVLRAGNTLSLGFSPGREELVTGVRKPEEGRQARGKAKQPRFPEDTLPSAAGGAHRGAALLLQPCLLPGAGPRVLL